MASLDVIALDPTVPQLRAPGVGDTYHFCRVVEFQDGTDAAPSITNVGDTNTGIYWPNADELAVSTGGVQRMSLGATTVFNETGADVDFRIEGDTDANLVFVDASTDRVGLGLNNPDRLLDVDGSSKFRGQILITSGEALSLGLQALQLPTGVESTIGAGLSTRTGVAGESIIQFGNNMNTYYTGSVNAAKAGAMIRIDTRGVEPTPGASAYSVFQIQTRAAGVADPNYTVPVQIGAAPQGTFCIQTNGLATFNYGFVVNEGGGDYDTRFEGDTDTHLFFADASTDRIGIGTNAPGYKLDVNGTANFANNVTFTGGTANGVLYLNASKVATSGSALTFNGTLFTNRPTSDANTNIARFGVINSAGTDDAFLNISADAANNLITLDSTGNNTGAFAFSTGGGEKMRLTAAGDLGIGTSSPTGKLHVNGIGYFGNTGASDTQLRLGALDASNTYFQAISGDGTTAKGYIFYNGSSVGMALTSSGNLGLGVTPSAWGGAKAFEAGLVGNYFIGSTAASYTSIGTAAYYNGTNWIYARSTAASKYELLNNTHAWFTAPSGTAGNTISFTQAMTLDASGNLLVGSTTNTSGLKLLASDGTVSTGFLPYGGGSIAYTGTWTNHAFGFATNGTERARITSVGNVGIGTTSPAYPLDVAGAVQSTGYYINGNTSGGFVWVRDNYALRFGTNDSERARITAGGFFKASNAGTYVGSTGTYHELRSDTADAYTVRITQSNATPLAACPALLSFTGSAPNDTSAWFLDCTDNVARRAYIRSNGGFSNFQSNDTDLSDIRTKKDITPAASMWDKIGALEIVTYKYNDQTHNDVNVGVIAQQVESVEPVWVDSDGWDKETPEGEEPLKTVYTKDITFAAIKALQEAMARIEKLEAEMAALKGV